MTTINRIQVLSALAMLLLAGCASGLGPDCVFCGARVASIHGYMTSRGPRPETQFVDENETRYVDGPAHVIGYFNSIIYAGYESFVEGFDRSTIYADRGSRVRGYGNATIYYREGADVRVQGQARAIKCTGTAGDPWKC